MPENPELGARISSTFSYFPFLLILVHVKMKQPPRYSYTTASWTSQGEERNAPQETVCKFIV